MKIKSLIVAAALATASTAAVAQEVTTPAGEVVIVEKNLGGPLVAALPGIITIVIAAVAAANDSQ